MRYKIGETVYVSRDKKGKIVDYSEVSHRYKINIDNQYSFLRDHDIMEVAEPRRKK